MTEVQLLIGGAVILFIGLLVLLWQVLQRRPQILGKATLEKRFVGIIGSVACVAILATGIGFISYETLKLDQKIQREMEIYGGLLSAQIAPSIDFDFRDQVDQSLEVAREEERIRAIFVFDRSGAYYTGFRKVDVQVVPATSANLRSGEFDGFRSYLLPIERNGETFGTLFILRDRADVWIGLRNYLVISFGIGIIAITGTIWLSFFVQRILTAPIRQLTETASSVTEDKDYSLRVDVESEDELGVLASSFNRMLVEIEKRESALNLARDTLEERVEERTRELDLALREAEGARLSAEEAARARSDFLAAMSHEFRTPLHGILGFAQILANEDSIPPERLERLWIMQKSGEHLLSLIEDILDMSKIDARKLELSLAPFNLNELLLSVWEVNNPRARQKKLELETYFESDLPSFLIGDEKRLRQILMNLLSNAIKFTESGKVKLRVTQTSEDGICFRIEDTGIGIEDELIPSLFEPFKRVETAERLAEGTGLGLAITKELVEMMGGNIRVESEVGKGSVFEFVLFLPTAASFEESQGILEGKKIVGYEGAPIPVLIVDDDWVNRKILKDTLEPIGFITSEAKDGKDAIEAFSELKPMLVLMDLRMPVMDGVTATRELRKLDKERRVTILAASAQAHERDRYRALEAGCHGFIAKPVRIEDLLVMIQGCLDLNWIYSETAHYNGRPGALDVDECPVPSKLRQRIIKLAKLGSAKKLKEELEAMGELPGLLKLSEHLLGLSRQFDFEQIALLAERTKEQDG